MNNTGLLKTSIEVASLDSIFASLGQTVVRFGVKLIAALAILVVGMWVANRLINGLRRMMHNRDLDPSLRTFLLSLFNIVLKAFVLIVVLATVGVHMTSIIAVLGAASLAVGMALSGTLQNFAGGIVILFFKPFKVGDSIETATGDVGVVKKIMIFTTELHTFDNQVVYLPNGALANGVITNLSQGAVRRTDLKLSIPYGARINVARRVIKDILKKNSRVLDDPAPVVYVNELANNSVVLSILYWTAYEDASFAKNEILEQLYEALPKKKINFPTQQMDVRVVK